MSQQSIVKTSQSNKYGSLQFLAPDYEPNGIIGSLDLAKNIVAESGINMPRMSKPKFDPIKWKEVIDIFEVQTISQLGYAINDYDISKCFKSLSIKVDDESPFTVRDLIKVQIDDNISDQADKINHIYKVLEYTIKKLPPVTAALMGGYLCEVRVYEKNNYYNNILPDNEKYGGLNRPYRRSIEVIDRCRCEIDNEGEFKDKIFSSSCLFLHELAHVVHNIYGYQRPGDEGYRYPSKKRELDSTGCIEPLNLNTHQSKFVIKLTKSYVLHHMDCYDEIDGRGYCTTHPVESFACAFETVLRNGETRIVNDYPQFIDVFRLLM